MSLQDLSEYHGLIRLNKVLFLDDIIPNTKLFKSNELDNDLVEIIPLFYCDEITVSEPSDDVLIFETYKIILPSNYNGLIHFKSEVEDVDCEYTLSFQHLSTLILIYNRFLENVADKTFIINYYYNNEIVYSYNGFTDEFGYNQHQVPSNIEFDDMEVIL